MLFDFGHDGIQRQDHKGQIVVNHTEHDRTGGVDHFKRSDAEQTEKFVDQPVALQQGHPCIGAQKKVHPHWQHYKHDHDFLPGIIGAGNDIGKRITDQKADHRGNDCKPDGIEQGGSIFADGENVFKGENGFFADGRLFAAPGIFLRQGGNGFIVEPVAVCIDFHRCGERKNNDQRQRDDHKDNHPQKIGRCRKLHFFIVQFLLPPHAHLYPRF